MAKLRMTYKNLKALRKSKEYQAMLVDLVASGVISKSKAEDLLGFNIPANLIGGTESSGTDNPIDEPGTGGEGTGTGGEGTGGEGTGGEGTGGEGTGGKIPETVIVPVKVFVDSAEPITVGTYTIPSSWETIDYGLSSDVDEYVFGDNFTPNENWSADYDYGASIIYSILEPPRFENSNIETISLETAPSELPEGAYIAVVLATTSSSSSS